MIGRIFADIDFDQFLSILEQLAAVGAQVP